MVFYNILIWMFFLNKYRIDFDIFNVVTLLFKIFICTSYLRINIAKNTKKMYNKTINGIDFL